MNAERLLRHYEQIADASDAIARLRRFILDLAVRGKLVPQDPADEPASQLLKRIATESHESTSQSRTKSAQSDEMTTTDPGQLNLPFGWERTSIKSVLVSSFYGPRFDATDYRREGIPTIRTTDMTRDGRIELRDPPLVAVPAERLEDFRCRDGDLLVTRTGSIGTMALFVGNLLAIPSAYLIRFRFSTHVSPRYMHLVLQSPSGQAALGLGTTKVAQPNINAKAIAAIDFNLAPLAEQHRIVAKVDELMALCDGLEAARAERETKRDRLAAASLARLNIPDPETFRDDARFALDALPALTARPDQIKQLRQTILNLAVRGKLVPQDPADEPAEVLLSKARLAKEALRKERRINRDEDPEFSTSSNESQSPAHWSWAYLADFALVQGGKRLPAGADFSADPTEHVYIRVTDMKNNTISSASLKYVSKDVHEAISKYVINKEDIYITIAGTIGCVGEVPDFLDGHNLTENAAKIVFRKIDRRFLILALSSDDVQSQFAEKTKQMAQPKLALKRVLGARIPIPPLAEQHRIVTKVDELMALCDELENSLTSADETRKKLLDALLAEALSPVDAEALQDAAE